MRQIGITSDASKADIPMKICVWNWEIGTMPSSMYQRCTTKENIALETFKYSCTNTCRDPIVYFLQFEKSQIHKTFLKWHLSCYIGIFDVKKFVFSDIPRAKRMCYWKVRPPRLFSKRSRWWQLLEHRSEFQWVELNPKREQREISRENMELLLIKFYFWMQI